MHLRIFEEWLSRLNKNLDTHMDTVDDVKVNLMSMDDMHKEFVSCLSKGSFNDRRSAKDIYNYNRIQVQHSRTINRANVQTDSGIRTGKFYGVPNNFKKDSRSYSEIIHNFKKKNQVQEQKMDIKEM